MQAVKSIGLIVLSLMISGPAVGDESSGKNYHRLFAEIMEANAKAITECKSIAKSRPPPSDHVVRQLLAIKKAHLYSFIRYSHDRATFLCEQRHGAYPAEYLYFLKADDNLPVDLKTQVSLYAELVSDPALLDRFNGYLSIPIDVRKHLDSIDDFHQPFLLTRFLDVLKQSSD